MFMDISADKQEDELFDDDPDNDSYCMGSSSDFDGEEEDGGGSGCGDSDDGGCRTASRPDFVVLSEAEIRRRQQEDVSMISAVFSLTPDSATTLLHRYGWNSGKAQDAWFGDEDAVRRAVGLLPGGGGKAVDGTFFCRICLEDCALAAASASACGHPFCGECWGGYVAAAIADGLGCLTLRCPDPGCCAAVGRDMAERFATQDGREKYSRYLVRSFVEGKRDLKWCPSPGCEFAVQFSGGSSSVAAARYEVRCNCSHDFCWNCLEEAHSPLDCDAVAKWLLKNGSEAENTKWILAYCKPCPKCRRSIEKNQGCMHMVCRDPCNYHFCWLCLGEWVTHNERTGGFYSCNIFEKEKVSVSGEAFQAEQRRKRAAASLERYTHYYERWAANHKSRQNALEEVAVLDKKLERLSAMYGQPLGQLTVMTEAWLQIVECRRVLKWTYAYGYYLLEAKKGFFEYLQGEAEWGLDQLHNCAEKEMEQFVLVEAPMIEEFFRFREKLAHLTAVTKNYFKNLVRAFEAELGGMEFGDCGADGRECSPENQQDIEGGEDSDHDSDG